MENIIENEDVRVTVADDGAELVSLINKKSGKELIWQADPEYWGRHAPLLFPNVGKHYNDEYLLDGKIYPANRHGFIRDKAFDVVESSGNAITLIVESDKESKENYPYDFHLNVSYELEGNNLTIIWEVYNESDEPMYFTIGAHPAFNTFPKKNDYYLYFPGKDELTYKLLDPEYECVEEKEYTLKLKNNRLHLDDDLFRKDALIFDNFQIDNCILESTDGEKILALHSPGFASYGIWSKIGAPFICLEPWSGRADDMNFNKDLSEKNDIIKLQSGGVYQKSYTIEVL